MLAGLVLLVIVAAAPAFAVLLNLQRELRHERERQAETIALQQAELLNAGLGNLVEGMGQTMSAIAGSPAVQALEPSCQGIIDGIRARMRRLAFIAVLGADGRPVCASAPAAITPALLDAIAAGLAGGSRFRTGFFTAVPGRGPILPFALPLAATQAGGGGLVLAGLDLSRLATALNATRQPVDGVSVVADANGTVLAARPEAAAQPGAALGPAFQPSFRSAAPVALAAMDRNDRGRVVGSVPAANGRTGLFVAASFDMEDLSGGADRAARRGYLLIAFGVATSFLLALLVGQRTLRAPAAVLLQAARRWGAGDLSARAIMPRSGGAEFADLARAFNTMAETLAGQQSELQRLNEALEVRVAERTRALLESNNRLQVEIAERELTEANLRQAQKLQVVGQLAGGIAHDFNNLLTVILGSVELLRSQAPDAPRAGRLFDNAIEAVHRGTRLTAQLLAFSRKQPLLAVSVDVAAAIRGMVGLLSATLGAAYRVEARVDGDLWPCMLDPNQFEAAILNLALNAREAMHKGGRVTIAAANTAVTPADGWPELAPGDYVRVSVADSGVGMTEDVLNRAFEPFFTTKETGQGSGLGLSQVHGMVRQSGGSVVIESRPGAGTKVVMLLPRTPAPALAQGLAEAPGPALEQDRMILLVDDDTGVREVTAAMLLENGYSVLTAPDGPSGLEILVREGEAVAIVIADYAMPGMTGRELLEAVRSRRPDVACLLATGYADYAELVGDELTVEQIVRKPFRSKELLARIQMVHRRKLSERVAAERIVMG